MALALLCPGQGAQYVGMGRDFYESSGVARGVYDGADKELGFHLSALCFHGPEATLNATDVAQVAIFVTSVAIYETLLETGRLPQTPAMTAGLSLGEYTALYLAGVLEFRQALRLVRARGRLMQAAAEAAPSTMLALIGADEAVALDICRVASEAGVVVPANFNAPGQIVLSGGVAACTRAAEVAAEKGLRTAPLKVAGAFHSPFMQSAADGLEPVLAETNFAPPAIPVLSNVTAQPHTDAAAIRALLVQQVVAAVRWYQCIETLRENGITEFLEVGPGRALTGLMKKIDRRAAITNVSSMADANALPAKAAGTV